MKRAFVFPGQGSQAVGMGCALAEAFASARQVLAEVGALEGFQALSGDAEFVAQRQSDAPFAQIEGQNPALGHEKSSKPAG